MITEQDLKDWFEGHVTQHFFSLLKSRLELTYRLRSEVFFPGEPNKTQEAKANLLGCEGELGEIVDAFERKTLDILEVQEQDSAEPIRNSPVRRQGAHQTR